MSLVKIKRPDAVNVLRDSVNGDYADNLTRLELHTVYTYINALENANSQLQEQAKNSGEPEKPKAFRAICQRHWCKRVHYGSTQQEAQTNAEQCNHLPNSK